jgi:hypothetical protein
MSRRRIGRPQSTTDSRSPEERLEALVREASPERARRMMGRILADLDANPEPGPWLAAARSLGDRLVISFDAVYYFAEKFTECLILSASGSDTDLLRIQGELQAIERAHGLTEDEYWRLDEAPDEWRALNDAWDARSYEIVGAALRAYGHSDLAEVYEREPKEFEHRSGKGQVDVWGEGDSD